MQPLSAYDLLRVWELGQNRATWSRALLLLATAFPGAAHRDLASLSIGTRNTYLFALRERTFGPTLEAVSHCPACSQPIEFSTGVRDLCDVSREPTVTGAQSLLIGETEVHFRALTTLDLAAVADSYDVAMARLGLVRRCITRARRRGADLVVADLPEVIVAAVGEKLSSWDSAADIRLELNCPVCGHAWSSRFDIAAFFWSELASQVQRVLRDVDLLARAYGWRETDILTMSPFRRQAYLNLVNG